MENKKTCLVTGGAGFIGSNLCRSLLKKDNHVICLDNLSSGRIESLEEFKNNPDFEFIHKDVTQPLDYSVDLIFNLACPASPVFYQKNPVATLQTNFVGALNVLNLAEKNGCKIFHASTSEVYGDPKEFPQKETYWGNVNPVGIRSCYDEGKRVVECLFMDYYKNHGTKIKIARLFNVYGPGMRIDDGRLVSNCINQALKNEAITVYGEGNQTRSLCYIDDLLEGVFKLMDTEENITGPVNLGNPDERTVLDIAKLIKNLTNSESEIKMLPLPKDDPKRRCPDISLAKKLLYWEPEIDLETGLKRTIKYFKNL